MLRAARAVLPTKDAVRIGLRGGKANGERKGKTRKGDEREESAAVLQPTV
jgi:hypothetical protein